MKALLIPAAMFVAFCGIVAGDVIKGPVNCHEVIDLAFNGNLNVYLQCESGFTGIKLDPKFLRRAY
jgi:hypothetical protein